MKSPLKMILLLAFTLLTTSACRPKDTMLTKMHIGYFPNVTHAQALIGIANGTFQSTVGKNVEVIFHNFNAGPSEIISYFSDELDIGYIGPVPAINGCIKSNGDLLIIAGSTHAGAMLVVSETSNIQSISDLSHKRIAIPQFGNTQHLSLLSLLKTHQLSDTTQGGTVEILSAENPNIYQMFLTHQIDAAYLPEPWASRLVIDASGKILMDYDEVFLDGNYSSTVVVARKSFVEKHPDLVYSFLKAHYALTMDIQKDPIGARETIKSQIKKITGKEISDELLASSFSKLKFSYDPIAPSIDILMEMAYEEKFIEKTVPIGELFDLDILNRILKEMEHPQIAIEN